MNLVGKEDALSLLKSLGAPARLVRHGQLVAETAEELLDALRKLSVQVTEEDVLVGAVLHDAGKLTHTEEMHGPGSHHETEGERLLLEAGVPTRIARIARTHADWESPEASLEDLLVALADKLWKGKRSTDLELLVIDELAKRLAMDRWELFVELDSAFEAVAAEGPSRLKRSSVPAG